MIVTMSEVLTRYTNNHVSINSWWLKSMCCSTGIWESIESCRKAQVKWKNLERCSTRRKGPTWRQHRELPNWKVSLPFAPICTFSSMVDGQTITDKFLWLNCKSMPFLSWTALEHYREWHICPPCTRLCVGMFQRQAEKHTGPVFAVWWSLWRVNQRSNWPSAEHLNIRPFRAKPVWR